jgi:cytochrome c oxidase subunit III
MATTVTSTRPLTKSGFGSGPKGRGPNGNGANGHKRPFPDFQSSASRYRIGVWVALASILMMFTALSSAYIVRAASSSDWTPLRMPRMLLLSSALILISSGTMEATRRKWKDASANPKRWLLITVALGVGFLVSQLLAWRQLVRQGVYVASNPHSSFFYLFTAAHAVHLFGGLLALAYLLVRSRSSQADEVVLARTHASAEAVSLYWHFMDFLWIYLFVLLFYVR